MADDLRTRIANAIRDADSHSCGYQEGINADELADAVLAVLPDLCGASAPLGLNGQDIGPCIRRAAHDGPWHQAADGGWWRRTDPAEEARAVIQGASREELHDAIRTLARLDPVWWRAELDRMARTEGRTNFLGKH